MSNSEKARFIGQTDYVPVSLTRSIAVRIPGETSEAVMAAVVWFKIDCADRFSQVFQTITIDNGSEFTDFSQAAAWGAQVYFAQP